jgi:hypothetical protein
MNYKKKIINLKLKLIFIGTCFTKINYTYEYQAILEKNFSELHSLIITNSNNQSIYKMLYNQDKIDNQYYLDLDDLENDFNNLKNNIMYHQKLIKHITKEVIFDEEINEKGIILIIANFLAQQRDSYKLPYTGLPIEQMIRDIKIILIISQLCYNYKCTYDLNLLKPILDILHNIKQAPPKPQLTLSEKKRVWLFNIINDKSEQRRLEKFLNNMENIITKINADGLCKLNDSNREQLRMMLEKNNFSKKEIDVLKTKYWPLETILLGKLFWKFAAKINYDTITKITQDTSENTIAHNITKSQKSIFERNINNFFHYTHIENFILKAILLEKPFLKLATLCMNKKKYSFQYSNIYNTLWNDNINNIIPSMTYATIASLLNNDDHKKEQPKNISDQTKPIVYRNINDFLYNGNSPYMNTVITPLTYRIIAGHLQEHIIPFEDLSNTPIAYYNTAIVNIIKNVLLQSSKNDCKIILKYMNFMKNNYRETFFTYNTNHIFETENIFCTKAMCSNKNNKDTHTSHQETDELWFDAIGHTLYEYFNDRNIKLSIYNVVNVLANEHKKKIFYN